jgi:hypothetical protein
MGLWRCGVISTNFGVRRWRLSRQRWRTSGPGGGAARYPGSQGRDRVAGVVRGWVGGCTSRLRTKRICTGSSSSRLGFGLRHAVVWRVGVAWTLGWMARQGGAGRARDCVGDIRVAGGGGCAVADFPGGSAGCVFGGGGGVCSRGGCGVAGLDSRKRRALRAIPGLRSETRGSRS